MSHLNASQLTDPPRLFVSEPASGRLDNLGRFDLILNTEGARRGEIDLRRKELLSRTQVRPRFPFRLDLRVNIMHIIRI